MKRMAVKVTTDHLFLVVYGTANPTDEEWAAYLDLVRHQGIDRTKHLICTDGGEPSASQARSLNELLGGRTVPVAVVSSSTEVRLAVMALSWFNGKIRDFPPWALEDAIAYLEIPRSRTDLIELELEKLRLELGLLVLGAAPPAPPPAPRRWLEAGRRVLAAVRRRLPPGAR
jgi:hypothetical protein